MECFAKHRLLDTTFILSSNKYIYWEEKKTIILSDLHLGKTGYFRQQGVAMPQNIYKDDLYRLFNTIQLFKPENLLIVGDLFHSCHNKEIDLFLKWRKDLINLNIYLIQGNHDVLSANWYNNAQINVSPHLIIDRFYFIPIIHNELPRRKQRGIYSK